MRRPDRLPRWVAVTIFLLVSAAAIGAEVVFGLWPIVRSLIVISAFFWCFQPFGAKRRAMEERLGGPDEVRRCTRAWVSGEVPPDANRSLWLAEIPHLPDGTAHHRIRRSSAAVFVVLAVVTIGSLVGAATTTGEARDVLGLVGTDVAPLAILVGVLALMLRRIQPPEQRTERLRRALGTA